MAESLADRIRKSWDVSDSHRLIQEVRALEAETARYKYTPQAYDEMWKRVKEVVNENDELKAENAELKDNLEDCDGVNSEIRKKVARLEKSINNQETDNN